MAYDALAQTLPSGVISAPPTVIGDNESIGSNTTLIVVDGGSVGRFFRAGLAGETNSDLLVDVSGGSVGADFVASAGSEIRISGGSFERGFVAAGGSTVAMTGGAMTGSFRSAFDSTVTISGGVFGRNFFAGEGSVELIGGNFKLNGLPFTGTSVSLADIDQSFTGTLADGSPFIFYFGPSTAEPIELDRLQNVTITSVELPPINATPIQIDSSSDSIPVGLREGQTLTLQEGGVLPRNFASIDANLNVDGGAVLDYFEAVDSTVNMSAGSIGRGFRSLAGSTVNVAGGVVGNGFQALTGSTVNVTSGVVGTGFTVGKREQGTLFLPSTDLIANISGGWVGDNLWVGRGAEVNVSGARVGANFQAAPGSTVRVSGGAFGDRFAADNASDVEFFGNDFLLNGIPFEGDTISLAQGDLFSGVYADGSPFLLNEDYRGDEVRAVTVTRTALPPTDLVPIYVDASTPLTRYGLRKGETLTLLDGGVIGENFTAVGATVSIVGGATAPRVEVIDTVAFISGGLVGEEFRAYAGSEVTISGGTIGERFQALPGSRVVIEGGTIGESFTAHNSSSVDVIGGTLGGKFTVLEGSDVNVRGGTFGEGLEFSFNSEAKISGGFISSALVQSAKVFMNDGTVRSLLSRGASAITMSGGVLIDASLRPGGVLNLNGGTVLGRLSADGGTTLNLSGIGFLVDGSPVDLVAGMPTLLPSRDVTLSGLFADGSSFEFDLRSDFSFESDYFDTNATITLTLVPEPGDFNGDGLVDAADEQVWRTTYGETVIPFSGADGNGDGVIDAADYTVWRDNVTNDPPTVPEPAAGVLLLMAASTSLPRRRS